MWNRSELKTKGKKAFKANYWRCVLVALLISIATGTMASSSRFGNNASNNSEDLNNAMNSVDSSSAIIVAGIVAVIAIIAIAIAVALSVFIFNPLVVGCRRFFVLNSNAPERNFSALSTGFKYNYANVVKASFATDIYTVLWTLLFIVPGILKAYSWMLVPYLLAENPSMNGKEAREMSAALMYGKRWNTFVLQISFILWFILSGITLGIVGIFYVGPYYNATMAEWYKVVRFGGQQA